MDLLDALAGAADTNPEGRIYGFVLGRVTDISDPSAIGRVKARYGAMDAASSSDWIMPAWMGAMEGLPRVGDYILVAFIDGNIHKGLYFTTALTRSQNRPVDFVPLGLQIVGLYNDLVDKFNNLKSKFNSHTHIVAGITAGTASVTSATAVAQDTDADAAKGLDGRGSVVSSVSSSVKVLSSEAKIR